MRGANVSLHSYVIFCDDIRQEMSGKLIFVGVYHDQMFFNGPAPWLHPMFHMHIVVRMETQRPVPVNIEVRAEDETGTRVLWKVENAPFDASTPPVPFGLEPPRNKMAQGIFDVTMSPLVLERDTRLSVVAIIDGKEELIDRLRVSQPVSAP